MGLTMTITDSSMTRTVGTSQANMTTPRRMNTAMEHTLQEQLLPRGIIMKELRELQTT